MPYFNCTNLGSYRIETTQFGIFAEQQTLRRTERAKCTESAKLPSLENWRLQDILILSNGPAKKQAEKQ